MRLLELLGNDGPATATGLAKRLGENTGTVSWHLRHLAEHRFIEEDTERGTKRERWWKATDESTELDTTDFSDDPAAKGAADFYLNGFVQELFSAVLTHLGEEWDDAWRGASRISRNSSLRLTPERLRALNTEVAAVVARYGDAEPEPGSLPVTAQWQAFPRREQDAR
jgi:DNA-binding MarR family transcriptional regulator